jgi:hypothetical protein
MRLERMVDQSFSDPSFAENAKDLLSEIRANWREADKELRRAVGLIVLLAVVFDLLGRQAVSEVNVGLVKLSKPEFIQQAIPVIVAYLFGSAATHLADIVTYSRITDMFMGGMFKTLSRGILKVWSYALMPSNSLVRQGELTVMVHTQSSALQWMLAFMVIRLFMLIAGPILLEIYMYITLFSRIGFQSAVLWISFALSLPLTAQGVLATTGAYLNLEIDDEGPEGDEP